MVEKRYFWIKLKSAFFNSKEIKKLRRIAGGDTLVVIYLKMLLKSIESEGYLYFDGIEDDFAEELALDLDETTENVQLLLGFLSKNRLIEEKEADSYFLPQALENIGSESSSAERKRRSRLNVTQKSLEVCDNVTPKRDNVTPMSHFGHTEIEIDIEKELEKELETDKELESHSDECDISHAKSKPKKKIFGEYQNVKLTSEEYQRLTDEFGEKTRDEYIDRLSGYIASKGDKYKSHNATIRNWMKKDRIGKKVDRNAIPEGCYRDEQGNLRGRYGEIII